MVSFWLLPMARSSLYIVPWVTRSASCFVACHRRRAGTVLAIGLFFRLLHLSVGGRWY